MCTYILICTYSFLEHKVLQVSFWCHCKSEHAHPLQAYLLWNCFDVENFQLAETCFSRMQTKVPPWKVSRIRWNCGIYFCFQIVMKFSMCSSVLFPSKIKWSWVPARDDSWKQGNWVDLTQPNQTYICIRCLFQIQGTIGNEFYWNQILIPSYIKMLQNIHRSMESWKMHIMLGGRGNFQIWGHFLLSAVVSDSRFPLLGLCNWVHGCYTSVPEEGCKLNLQYTISAVVPIRLPLIWSNVKNWSI